MDSLRAFLFSYKTVNSIKHVNVDRKVLDPSSTRLNVTPCIERNLHPLHTGILKRKILYKRPTHPNYGFGYADILTILMIQGYFVASTKMHPAMVYSFERSGLIVREAVDPH